MAAIEVTNVGNATLQKRVFRNAGAPTDGAAGTYAGQAAKGDLLIDTTNGGVYQNTNTQASPTWGAIGDVVQASAIVSLTDNGGGAAANDVIAAVTAPTAQTDNSGGAANATLAAQTLPTALTDNGGGTADGTVQAQPEFAASTPWDGATVFPSAADEAALTAVALAARNNMKEVTTTFAAIRAQLAILQNVTASYAARQAENRLAIIALTDAVKELSTKQNEVIAALETSGVIAS